MVSFFDVLNLNTSLWDIIEFKLIVLFVTVVLAVLLGDRINR
jgi:nitrogen fixation/metabolism regulation signal transduction histidine kinase